MSHTGGTVDAFGLHPLSCRQNAGRFPRHKAINDIVNRAIDAAGMHAILEPTDLDRGDGKRPDGITTFPLANGECLAWDATWSDTFSPSALSSLAAFPGSKSYLAEAAKQTKYKSRRQIHICPHLNRNFRHNRTQVATFPPSTGTSNCKSLGRIKSYCVVVPKNFGCFSQR